MNPLTDEQRRAVTHPGSVVVRAGAGSGKTRVLAERVVWLLRHGLRPRELVAVTFTDAAALELRQRIGHTLALQGEAWSAQALERLGEARIGTLHRLCADILREHPVESAVGPDFEVMDAAEGARWLSAHLDPALLRAVANETLPSAFSAANWRSWCETLLGDEHAAEAAFVAQNRGGLTGQWATLEATLGRVAEVIRQVQELGALLKSSGATDPQDPLEAVRLRVLEVYARFGMVGEGGPEAPLDLLDWREAIGEALEKLRKNSGRAAAWPQGKQPTLDALHALEALGQKEAEALSFGRDSLAVLPLLERVYRRVSRDLLEQRLQAGQLNFDDLERLALGALLQPQVQAYYAARIRAVLLDEAQDTSPVQAEIVRLLCGEHASLTAVGDAQQSIYGFRRAEPALFAALGTALGEVSLAGSFRAAPALSAVLNAYFSLRIAEGGLPFVPQQALRPGDPLEVRLEWHRFERSSIPLARQAEAQFFAQRLATLCQSEYRPSQVALLLRSRTDLSLYTQALGAVGLPYTVGGGDGLFERPEVGDALSLLRLLADPLDDLALVSVLRSPFGSFSDASLFALAQGRAKGEALSATLGRASERLNWLSDLLLERAHLTPARALKRALEASGYLDVLRHLPEGPRARANLDALLGWLRARVTRTPSAWDLMRLLEGAPLPQLPEAAPSGIEALTVTTVHGAKGLEFEVVCVPDLTRKQPWDSPALRLDPQRGVAVRRGARGNPELYTQLEAEAKVREARERERLEYVAFTRARERLLLGASVRSSWGAELLEAALPGVGVLRQIHPDPALDLSLASPPREPDVIPE